MLYSAQAERPSKRSKAAHCHLSPLCVCGAYAPAALKSVKAIGVRAKHQACNGLLNLHSFFALTFYSLEICQSSTQKDTLTLCLLHPSTIHHIHETGRGKT